MAEWSLDLKKYAESQKKTLQSIHSSVVFSLYKGVLEKTPIDTGRARGNWNVSEGKDDTSTSENRTPQYTHVEQLPKHNGDEATYISNNLPYIKKLEYGGYPNPPKKGKGKTVGGYSRQAPKGMVGLTVANFNNFVEKAVEESKRK